jgi:hypothetical protein
MALEGRIEAVEEHLMAAAATVLSWWSEKMLNSREHTGCRRAERLHEGGVQPLSWENSRNSQRGRQKMVGKVKR